MQVWFPSTHMAAHNLLCNSNSKGFRALFWPSGALHAHYEHTSIQPLTRTKIKHLFSKVMVCGLVRCLCSRWRLLLPTLIIWVWSWDPRGYWRARALGSCPLTSACVLWQVHVQEATHIWNVGMLVSVLPSLKGFQKSWAVVCALLYCQYVLICQYSVHRHWLVFSVSPSCYWIHSGGVRGALKKSLLLLSV